MRLNSFFLSVNTVIFITMAFTVAACKPASVMENPNFLMQDTLDDSHPRARLVLGSEKLVGNIRMANIKFRKVGLFTQAQVGIQNLSDVRYTLEYKVEWDQNRYNRKVANIAQVISELHENTGADLIGFCEIQSDQALKDIISNLPGGTNEFDIIHHNSPDIRAIDIGFIYRKSKLANPVASAHNIRKRYPTRDIMDVKFDLNNGKQA